MFSRLVRVVNVAIAVAAVLIAGAVYWYALRPLPKTSGEIAAPIAKAAVIRRDARGIPHIEASSWQDAIFLQGYVTAQDRLWQMDVIRRFGAGELAEVFGPGALESDIRSRRMRMRAIAQIGAGRLNDDERELLAEYARGVNWFIETHRGDYSLEFSLPGHAYNPRPWTVSDSLLIGLVMFRELTDLSRFEFALGQAFARAKNPAKLATLFPAVEGEYVSPGSNAWAVSGRHTPDGVPILANDPHLPTGIPGTWHLVHLKAPGLNVSGAALPGLPCVITGHNDRIAWGVTNLETDVLDLYIEQMDPRNGTYLFQGRIEQAQLDRETIPVRGRKPAELEIWVTRHGPVVATGGGKSYSMKWSAAEGFHFPFLSIDRAQNWDQFRTALSMYSGPAQNFVYADRAGNIGYQASGRVPIRRGFDGNVPLDGSSGKFEWEGYIPYEQLPSLYNPPSGMIATANQNPFPPDFAYRVDGGFADPYRVRQIRARLTAKEKLSVDDMLAIQKDVYSAYDAFLAHQAIRAFARLGSRDGMVRAAVRILRRWNGQMEKSEAAPMITELLSNRLRQRLMESPMPDILPRPQILETLLRTRPRGWVANDDWDTWLIANFAIALHAGRRAQGSHLERWRWGRMLEWKLDHPVGQSLPFFSRFFDLGPVEMSGSGSTVKQTLRSFGPSERMVVDLGDLDRSVQNLAVGESGFVASAHYKDQWPAYYVGKSFPMQFDHVDAKDVLRVRPR